MAESVETAGFTFVESSESESHPQDSTEPSHPTPTPRAIKQETAELTSAGDQQIVLDQLYQEKEAACNYEEYTQVLRFCEDKERKDIVTMQSLPQLMKDTLFFQNEELLASSQDRVKASSANDEEFRKFVKYLKSVVSNHQDQNQREKAQKLLDILNNAALIASTGQTSVKCSNRVFEKLSPVFQEATNFSGDQVEVSYLPLDLLKEANNSSKQRQQHLQSGDLDSAEKCLSEAMEKIEVSVGRAEQQKSCAEKRYTEVACTNRHISVQKLEKEILEAIVTDKNRINILKTHCCEDLQRIERATNTLDKVFNNSKQHYQQLDDLQIDELRNNKNEQEQLESRLKQLRESAKKIDQQRKHAAKQDKSADRMYQDSREKVLGWEDQIKRLEAQTQHASSALGLIQECSDLVTSDFYQVHQLYLSDLNTLAVESLQLYRKCLVGRIVACKFRNQELETNISSLEHLLKPKKEELKQHRKTGLKVMADKTAREVSELGDYKHAYMSAKQSLEGVLVDAFDRLGTVDDAIMKRVPDAKLESVDVIYEEERLLQDAEWDNLEMQSLTKAYYC